MLRTLARLFMVAAPLLVLICSQSVHAQPAFQRVGITGDGVEAYFVAFVYVAEVEGELFSGDNDSDDDTDTTYVYLDSSLSGSDIAIGSVSLDITVEASISAGPSGYTATPSAHSEVTYLANLEVYDQEPYIQGHVRTSQLEANTYSAFTFTGTTYSVHMELIAPYGGEVEYNFYQYLTPMSVSVGRSNVAAEPLDINGTYWGVTGVIYENNSPNGIYEDDLEGVDLEWNGNDTGSAVTLSTAMNLYGLGINVDTSDSYPYGLSASANWHFWALGSCEEL